MLGDIENKKELEDGTVAKIKPFDECCYLVEVIDGEDRVESGIWCPKSKRLVVDGSIIGHYDTKEEVLDAISPREVSYKRYF